MINDKMIKSGYGYSQEKGSNIVERKCKVCQRGDYGVGFLRVGFKSRD